MKLIVSETTVQDAVIPLRWCLSKGELEKLKDMGAINPHLLVVTVYEQQEVDRYLIPLDQMLAYIQFHKPGKNRILATVVWDFDGNTSKLKEKFLSQGSTGWYKRRVLDYEQEKNLLPDDIGPRLKEQAEMTVMVPAEFFAKEPPAWEKRWVNLWFETQPRDQCQYRRRRMIAYTIQPPVVLLFTIFISIFRLLAVGVLLFLGKRGVDLKPIVHPFLHQSHDVWSDAEASVFLRNAKGKRQPPLITIFSPPALMSFLAILIGVRLIFPSLVSHLTLQWWYYPLGALAVAIGTTGIAYVVYGSLCGVDFLLTLLISDSPQREQKGVERRIAKAQRVVEEAEKRDEERRRREEQQFAERQRLLACDSELGFIPELKALPKEKQTIYLRFQNLKAKVCKPFAR